MPEPGRRRLTRQQQTYVQEAMDVVQPAIASFIKRYPNFRAAAKRCDLEAVAFLAITRAALTYSRRKSQVATYFGSAIRHALLKELSRQVRHDHWQIPKEDHHEPASKIDRGGRRAMQALECLNPRDKEMIENRIIEKATLREMGREYKCDPRTARSLVKEALKKLKRVEEDLP